jgi:opacity protein-like surface antigen
MPRDLSSVRGFLIVDDQSFHPHKGGHMGKANWQNALVLRSDSFFISILVIIFIITSASFAFSQTSQYQSIKGVKFKDGTIIRGQVIQMNTDIVTIKTPDGNTFVRKFDEVDVLVKDDGDTIQPESFGRTTETIKADYFVLKAGMYSPHSGDLEGFNAGFNGEIAFGHYFNRNFAAEAGVGYFNTGASASASISGIASASGNININVVPVVLTLKAIYPVQNMEMYALGGAGVYMARVDGSVNYSVNPYTFSASGSSTSTTLGLHLGAGANFNISREIFLGIEGKYIWVKADWQGIEPHLDGFIFTGNFGIRF